MLSNRKDKKIIIRAEELSDCDVNFISMVARPASRVPFSFTKSEEDRNTGEGIKNMFNKLFAKSEAKPDIHAIILKDEPTDAVKKALADLGVKVDTVQKSEDLGGVAILPQVPFNGDTMLVKMNDNIAVQVPMVKMDGKFATMMAEWGFYPAISLAVDILADQIHSAVYKAKDGGDAATMIGAMSDDFRDYMQQMVSALPVSVFKMEKSEELTNAFSTGQGVLPLDDVNVEDGSSETESIEKAVGKTKSKTGSKDDAMKMADGEDDMSDEDKKKKKAAAKKSEDDEGYAGAAVESTALATASVLKQEDLVNAVVAALTPSLESIRSDVTAMTDRVSNVEAVTKSVSETVNGTVVTNLFGDHTETKKSEGDYESSPLIDTAFGRLN